MGEMTRKQVIWLDHPPIILPAKAIGAKRGSCRSAAFEPYPPEEEDGAADNAPTEEDCPEDQRPPTGSIVQQHGGKANSGDDQPQDKKSPIVLS